MAGNMTTVPKPFVPTTGMICKYNAWNRMAETRLSPTVPAKYQYDGLNRRTIRSIEFGPTPHLHRYYSAAWQILEMRKDVEGTAPENAQPYVQYVWSARYIDAAVLRDGNTDSDGLCDDQRLYYLCEANFSVTTLTDTAGDALERYLYDPYGQVMIAS